MIFVESFTREDRIATVFKVNDVIQSLGGWVIDSTQFSNVAMTMMIEISAAKLPDIAAALEETGLRLAKSSNQVLSDAIEGSSGGSVKDQISLSLQITFIHSEPDLLIPVPSVPG